MNIYTDSRRCGLRQRVANILKAISPCEVHYNTIIMLSDKLSLAVLLSRYGWRRQAAAMVMIMVNFFECWSFEFEC